MNCSETADEAYEADEVDEEDEDAEGRRAETSDTMRNSAGRAPTAAVRIASPVETIALCPKIGEMGLR
jgi:hypothetical protein